MLGWINISICSFICGTFGVEKWEAVVAAAGVTPNWASSCPYSDKVTYDLVVTAAGLLGVSVQDALEAYGLYFVQHVEDQGYTRLLHVLGSNLAEFLQNLDDLHLHLQYCWPDMVPPSFRCTEVTSESLLLHYFSNRPGLWPIVVGVLKGLVKDYFKTELQVELVHSREKGDADHEVFKLSYPHQPALADWGRGSLAAQQSFFAMPPPLFYELHPFHLVCDTSLRLLQWGAAVGRVVPELQNGRLLHECFRCKVPTFIQLEYKQILDNTHSSFVLQGRSTGVTLKGQMLPTTAVLPGAAPDAPPTEVLVFLASPWMRSLADMQASAVFLSDIPRYDLSSDYILLAEQRQAEADLKDKFERLTLELQAANEKLAHTTAWLEEEKARAEALLFRMSGLIACFPAAPPTSGAAAAAAAAARGASRSGSAAAPAAAGQQDGQVQQLPQLQPSQQPVSAATSGPEGVLSQNALSCSTTGTSGSRQLSERHTNALDRIEAVRRELARANVSSSDSIQIQCLDLLGEGTYGKVYKGLWRGTVVAVKTIVLPAAMSGQEKREKMAIMEAAISSALSHPNIMQTYTYDIKPIKDNSRPQQKLLLLGSTTSTGNETGVLAASSVEGGGTEASEHIHSYEVRLVCEYCDRGSLREALDLGAFRKAGSVTGINYPAVLDTAMEIATAVAHLHYRNVLHSDLKARNIMLKSTGGSGRGATAKVADFGLAVKMDHMETHLSNSFQGTMTHMAPEILIKGHISKAADTYAFGMVLWELYTAKRVFKGIPRALLGHQITQLNRRPEFPPDAPEEYVKLTQQCWDPVASKRPTLDVAVERLQAMRAALRCPTEPLAAYDIETHISSRMSGASLKSPQLARTSAAAGGRRHAPPQKMPSAGQVHFRRAAVGWGAGLAGDGHPHHRQHHTQPAELDSLPVGGSAHPAPRRSISTPMALGVPGSPAPSGAATSPGLGGDGTTLGTASSTAGPSATQHRAGITAASSIRASLSTPTACAAAAVGAGAGSAGVAMAIRHMNVATAAASAAGGVAAGSYGSYGSHGHLASSLPASLSAGIAGGPRPAAAAAAARAASFAGYGEDSGGSEGGSSSGARSIYLEHSASTGDGDWQQQWRTSSALLLQEASLTTHMEDGSSSMQEALHVPCLQGGVAATAPPGGGSSSGRCPFSAAAAAAAAGGDSAAAAAAVHDADEPSSVHVFDTRQPVFPRQQQQPPQQQQQQPPH